MDHANWYIDRWPGIGKLFEYKLIDRAGQLTGGQNENS